MEYDCEGEATANDNEAEEFEIGEGGEEEEEEECDEDGEEIDEYVEELTCQIHSDYLEHTLVEDPDPPATQPDVDVEAIDSETENVGNETKGTHKDWNMFSL